MPELQRILRRDDALEVELAWVGCVHHAMVSGDVEGAMSLLAYRPSAGASVLPKWAQVDAQLSSKIGYQADERARAGWGKLPSAEAQGPPLVPGSGPTRRRRGNQLPDPKVPKPPLPNKPAGSKPPPGPKPPLVK